MAGLVIHLLSGDADLTETWCGITLDAWPHDQPAGDTFKMKTEGGRFRWVTDRPKVGTCKLCKRRYAEFLEVRRTELAVNNSANINPYQY